MPTPLVPSTTSESGWHDIWLQGRKEGELVGERRQTEKILAQLEHYQELQTQLAQANKQHAQIVTQIIFTGLFEAGIEAMQAFLRQNAIADVDVIISVPEDQFSAPEFDRALEVVDTIRGEYPRENFRLDISFLPLSGDLNSEALVADGYSLWYTPST